MDKRKLSIAIQVLKEVLVAFPDTKDFIDKKLEQKCTKGNKSVKEVSYFMLF